MAFWRTVSNSLYRAVESEVSATTRLLSTKLVSNSKTSEADTASPGQTASAAANVQPPEKTASRQNFRFSKSVRGSWLQSINDLNPARQLRSVELHYLGNMGLAGYPAVYNFACTSTVTNTDLQELSSSNTDGNGNFAAGPFFVDPLNGDYHLASGSPCRNMGNNAVITSPPFQMDLSSTFIVNLDSNPRIVDSVDGGAYDIQNSTSRLERRIQHR